MEVTGAVNVAEKFPAGLPPEPEQDAFIKDACTRMTDAYLAPIQLRSTTLTLIYSTISLPSWSAGSHQVSCSIGATLGNGGWSTLLNSAKGPLQINGQPPIPPPDIPEERLNFPPIPMPDTSSSGARAAASTTRASSSQSDQSTQQTQQTQQPSTGSRRQNTRDARPRRPRPATPGTRSDGNTFLNGASARREAPATDAARRRAAAADRDPAGTRRRSAAAAPAPGPRSLAPPPAEPVIPPPPGRSR